MKNESAKHKVFPPSMGGKTGTPERTMKYFDKEIERIVYTDFDKKRNGKMNDGWYIFFIEDCAIKNKTKKGVGVETAPLAVAIRMERLGAGISENAVRLTDKVVLKVLQETGYLSNKNNQ